MRKFTGEFVGQADMPFDFFMSRYKEAYQVETKAFIDALIEGKPAPCSGLDGLVALVMAMAAGKSADEGRWVEFGEIIREECIGDTCTFGTLLDDNGKLGKNWVRGALLSIERDQTDLADVEEVFVLFDIDMDGNLNEEEVDEVFEVLRTNISKDDKAKIYDAAKDKNGLVSKEKFISEYCKKVDMQPTDEERTVFEFSNVMD